jgi:tRNA pseudouridine55 synthase
MPRYDGIILIDKAGGITSHDAIDALRKITGQRKIGHTGTLDPLATGLLVICLGRATKLTPFMTLEDKTYRAVIHLGKRSTTYDAEGVDESTAVPVPEMTSEKIKNILNHFEGRIVQRVPLHAAVKVGGKKLYNLARQGKEIELPERRVTVYEIELTDWESPRLKCTIACSKGTYIRSLANDIGEMIGCGAYLESLRRTKVGDFSLDDALTLEKVEQLQHEGRLTEFLKPIEEVLDYPQIRVDRDFSRRIINGQMPKIDNIVEISGTFKSDDYISLRDYSGKIMAIGKSLVDSSELKKSSGTEFFKYVRVLN